MQLDFPLLKKKKKLLWLSKGSSSTCLSYRLFSSPSASLSHEVGDLQPHTEYAFRLVASNGVGSAHSAWIVFMTAEDSKWSEQCTAKCPLHRGISGVFTFFPKKWAFPVFLTLSIRHLLLGKGGHIAKLGHALSTLQKEEKCGLGGLDLQRVIIYNKLWYGPILSCRVRLGVLQEKGYHLLF